MRIASILMVLLSGILLASLVACGSGSSGSEGTTPTASTPVGTVPSSPSPTAVQPPSTTAAVAPSSCADDVKAIQSALDEYYGANNYQWPTAGGGGGDIQWEKLVPEYLPQVPASDATCDWQANTAPEGTVCLWDKSNKGSNCSCGSACTGQPGVTPESTTATVPTPTPTEPPECEEDRQAIQAALDAYVAATGEWPTEDGETGLIVWDKLVPDYLTKLPSTIKCKWQVNSDPVGQVCRSVHC